MDTYDAIANRKTIRDFQPVDIALPLLQKLIAAGFKAPTNNHMREWHFILLQDRSRRKELLDLCIHPVGTKGATGIVNRWGMKNPDQREMYIDAIPRQYAMLFEAGALLVPCFHQERPLLKPKDLSALNPFASIWCCIENILIAASAEGIFGVVRIPSEDERKTLKTFLNLPEGFEIPCFLALGYPAEGATRAKQVETPIEERIHFENW